jgi:hypothetical protein
MFTDILIRLIGSSRPSWRTGRRSGGETLAGPEAISRSSESAKARAPDNHSHPSHQWTQARTSQKQKRHIHVFQA